MSAHRLGRGRGTAIACAGEGCPAKSVTGQIRIKDHWAWLVNGGWGRGLDAGTGGRPFSSFGGARGMGGAPSREAIWWADSARSQGSLDLEVAHAG